MKYCLTVMLVNYVILDKYMIHLGSWGIGMPDSGQVNCSTEMSLLPGPG